MTTEEWRDFPLIGGRSFSEYEVSSLGQIRNKKTGYIFSAIPESSGYVRNEFRDDKGNEIKMSAHSVVVRTFLGGPKSDDLTIDHINRERADNRLVNLRWATKKQQVANSDQSNHNPIGQPVIQYTMEMKEIKRWSNIAAAAKELKISQSGISQACRGKQKRSRGFKWVYERQDLDGEIWRNYEPMDVQVSNMGRIKPPHSHILYGSKTSNGYLTYGKPTKGVHVMVAETFLSNPEKKPEVNHKDKIRTNNKLENLEWATKSEQAIHSHTNSNPDRYSNAKAVKQYDLEGNFIGQYESMNKASKQTGCSEKCISRVCSGLSKNTNGWVFEYSDKDVLNRPSRKYSRKIDLIDEKGNVLETYKSVKSAALDLDISYGVINNILRGKAKKTRKGYRFQYH